MILNLLTDQFETIWIKSYTTFSAFFFAKERKRKKIPSLLNLTSFFRLEIFLQICTFCNGISCPKVAFPILAKLRVDICMMAKIGFPGRRSTSRPISQASNFSTMTFTMVTYHITLSQNATIKVKSQNIELRNFHLGQKSVWV